MAKFKVFQDADYVQGHLRYGHREGIIEADSKEDALNKLKNEGYTDDLNLVVDDYSVYDAEFGDNEFEIEEIPEENIKEDIKVSITEQIEEIIKLYENDRYLSAYRYYCEEIDTEEKETYILDEIKELLDKLGVEYETSMESGIDTCSFSEDFYSIAWVENGKLKQYTFICESR